MKNTSNKENTITFEQGLSNTPGIKLHKLNHNANITENSKKPELLTLEI